MMSTSFSTPSNEWDSDVDDSNSSEEFMYVKGTPPPVPSPDLYKNKSHDQQKSKKQIPAETVGICTEEEVWNSHEDKVPVATSANGLLIITDNSDVYVIYIIFYFR